MCYPDVAGVFLKEFSFTCPKLGINSKAWPFSICVLFYSIGNTVYFTTVKVLIFSIDNQQSPTAHFFYNVVVSQWNRHQSSTLTISVRKAGLEFYNTTTRPPPISTDVFGIQNFGMHGTSIFLAIVFILHISNTIIVLDLDVRLSS